jgi:hypothetical protein
LVYEVKEYEMSGAYGTSGRCDKNVQSFGRKDRRKETIWKNEAQTGWD